MTQDLERKLNETQSALEEVRAEYQEFAYIVSHDLTGALRQIQGFSDILAVKHADNFDEKSARHLQLILEGTEKAKNILAALLTFSRLNTHEMQFSAVDCSLLVAEILEELSAVIEEKNAVIQVSTLPTITADRAIFYRMFRSLIINALTYHGPSTPPEISIHASENDDEWMFHIQDRGIGIKEAQYDKVFKVLRRGISKGYDSIETNLGMGLASAKRIIERHGGKIGFESKIENGSNFNFTVSKHLRSID